MPGNRSKRRNRGRACDGHSSGNKPTATTADNELTESMLVANKSLESPTPNASVHTMNEKDLTAAVCWICAEPVKYYSLSTCNHRTCHVCALRLRVLYEKFECTFCKVSLSDTDVLIRLLALPCKSHCRHPCPRLSWTGAPIDGHLHHLPRRRILVLHA